MNKRSIVLLIGVVTLISCGRNSGNDGNATRTKADYDFQQQIDQWASKGINLNQSQSFAGYQNYPVMLAATGCLEKSMESLLSHGVDVNVTDSQTGWSALHTLASHGTCSQGQIIRMINMLIQHGADVNASASNGTPLLLAIRDNKPDVAKNLIDHGANVNAMDSDSAMPLHWASFNGETEVVQLLINHGADINAKAQNGTPLAYCQLGRGEASGSPEKITALEATAKLLQAHGAQ